MTLKKKYTQDGYSGANQYGPYGSGSPEGLAKLQAAHEAVQAAGFHKIGQKGNKTVYQHPSGHQAHVGPPTKAARASLQPHGAQIDMVHKNNVGKTKVEKLNNVGGSSLNLEHTIHAGTDVDQMANQIRQSVASFERHAEGFHV